MPKIDIRERDLTTAGTLGETSNVVYVPGYANIGPINTPTLCSTLDEFHEIFGDVPYRFQTSYQWQTDSGKFDQKAVAPSMGTMYGAGDYEKSFVYAEQLLRLGMPVLYERIFNIGEVSTDNPDGDNVTEWTAKRNITIGTVYANSVGRAGKNIQCKITKNDKIYELSVKRAKDATTGLEAVNESTISFTFDTATSNTTAGIKLVKANDELSDDNNLVTVKFIDEASIVNDGDFVALAVTVTGDEFTPYDIYTALNTNGDDKGFNRFVDKGEYTVKYLTTGAYPSFEFGGNTITTYGLQAAANRGDCTFIIDHTPNNTRTLKKTDTNSVYDAVKTYTQTNRSNDKGEDVHTYGSMFTPYGIYETSIGDCMLPASCGYLSAFARQVSLTNGWLATAGVERGTIPYLKKLCQNVTNAVADSYQPRDSVAINPITNIKSYGLVIWGARTLKYNVKDLVATSFLNIRQLSNDVKATVWIAAKSLTFEQNNDILWIKFKSRITPLLDNMVNGNGLSAYDIKKQKTDKRATVKAVIRLFAVEPVEDWDITIELADSTVETSE